MAFRDPRGAQPPCRSWASESDAYKLLFHEPCNCLVALRLGIFFVVYPAVIAYLWFYYIPTRSIPK